MHSKPALCPRNESIFRDHDFAIHSRHEDQNHHAANKSVIEPQSGNSKCCEPTSSSHVRSSGIRPLPQFGQRKFYEQGTKRRRGSTNVITSSPYKKNLVTSLKMSSARQTRAKARKQELFSESKESGKKTKQPEAQNVSDSEYCSDFDRMSPHSESSDDTSDDGDDMMMFLLYLQLHQKSAWEAVGPVSEVLPLRPSIMGLTIHSSCAKHVEQVTNKKCHTSFFQLC
jgi:hypothetical protein